MLNLVLRTGDRIQIGDDVVIKLQSDSRAQLAIDAPREINIKRIAANGSDSTKKKSGGTTSAVSGKRIIAVDNSGKK